MFQFRWGLGGVGSGWSAACVGERSVFTAAVVLDGVDSEDLSAGRDLDGAINDRYLDLTAPVLLPDPIPGPSE